MDITSELEKLSKLHKDGALNDLEFEKAKSKLLGPPQASPSANYEILPDGRKRFLKATAIDVLISIFLPFWGLAVGGYAYFGKHEKKRGATMMIIGGCCLVLWIIANMSHPQ